MCKCVFNYCGFPSRITKQLSSFFEWRSWDTSLGWFPKQGFHKYSVVVHVTKNDLDKEGLMPL